MSTNVSPSTQIFGIGAPGSAFQPSFSFVNSVCERSKLSISHITRIRGIGKTAAHVHAESETTSPWLTRAGP